MSNYAVIGNDGKPAPRGNYVVKNGLHCEVFESGWNYKVWESKRTGQLEHKLWPRLVYRPMGDPDDPADADVWADKPFEWHAPVIWTMQDQEALDRKRLLALEKSARRAKQQCTHKIKHAGFQSLLTCTYGENMQDFDRMRRDWAAFMRKVSPHIPDFACVFAFERQKRGAWHTHAAIRKLPVFLWVPEGRGKHARKVMVRSWDYLRRCWRAIVGAGNIDVDGHRKRGRFIERGRRADESLCRLAGYVSKYLTKDHAEGPEGRNRWGSTQGLKPPRPRVLSLPPMSLIDAMDLAFHVPEGHRVARHCVWGFGKFWCLYTEPGGPE
ncbi:hypothetical protein [Hydrogenophaga sp. ANAO-22]|uniref:rolling circle replication-associated protein n=1 Tax=Hydrogenophaga sp. ANAO-22 TaxID=3166645 RepID=UPI0036D42084